jgi:hypothetical protein
VGVGEGSVFVSVSDSLQASGYLDSKTNRLGAGTHPTGDIGWPHTEYRGAGGSAGGAVSMATSVKAPPLEARNQRTASMDMPMAALTKP